MDSVRVPLGWARMLLPEDCRRQEAGLAQVRDTTNFELDSSLPGWRKLALIAFAIIVTLVPYE